MRRAEQAEAASQRVLREKPLVAAVVAARRRGDKGTTDAMYGPSLPVAWGEPNTMRAARRQEQEQEEHEGGETSNYGYGDTASASASASAEEGSPSRQVAALLAAKDRQRRNKSAPSKAQSLPGETDTSAAFLKAQARAHAKATAVSLAPKQHDMRPAAALLQQQKARQASGADRSGPGRSYPAPACRRARVMLWTSIN